jgi:hypothetical protein
MFYEYNQKNSKWKCYLIVATLFHYTAFISIAAVVIDKLKLKKYVYIIITSFFTILGFLHFDFIILIGGLISNLKGTNVLFKKVIIYGTNLIVSNFTIFDLFYPTIFIIFLIFSSKLNIFHALGIVFLFFSLLFPSTTVLISRLRYYFSISFIYLFFTEIKIKSNATWIKHVMIYGICFFIFLYNYVFHEDKKYYVPYNNYLVSLIHAIDTDPYDANRYYNKFIK